MKKVRITLTANSENDFKPLLIHVFSQLPWLKNGSLFHESIVTSFGLIQITVVSDQDENMMNMTVIEEGE